MVFDTHHANDTSARGREFGADITNTEHDVVNGMCVHQTEAPNPPLAKRRRASPRMKRLRNGICMHNKEEYASHLKDGVAAAYQQRLSRTEGKDSHTDPTGNDGTCMHTFNKSEYASYPKDAVAAAYQQRLSQTEGNDAPKAGLVISLQKSLAAAQQYSTEHNDNGNTIVRDNLRLCQSVGGIDAALCQHGYYHCNFRACKERTRLIYQENNIAVGKKESISRVAVKVIQEDSTWIISSAGLRLGVTVNQDAPFIPSKPKRPSFGKSVLQSARFTARKMRLTRMLVNETKRETIHLSI